MTHEELKEENRKLKSIIEEATTVIDEILVSGRNETGRYYPAPYSLDLANEFQGRYMGAFDDDDEED